MKCPFCQFGGSKVIDKRSAADDLAIRRRRECLKCGKRYSSYERIEEVPLIIIKKDLTRVQFDRSKLLRGLLKACEKRPISMEQIEAAASELEARIKNKQKTEISTKVIGKEVMKVLKKLDKVAYIRFASVYRDFADLDDFEQEIHKLLRK